MSRFEIRHGRGVVRFLHFFNYPATMSAEEGDKWYFSQHVPQAKRLRGLVRYRTWRGLPPIKMWTYDPYDRFVRVSELAFESLEQCLQATTRNPELWALATGDKPGFRELECMMVDEEPQYDLLKDVPVQQYKYMQQPAKFTGEPEYDEADDTFLDIYMFNYKVSNFDGEDWYLGHHVREGRIIKTLGRRHYQTWKGLTVPDEQGSALKPNRFYRITELGLADWYRGKPRPGGTPKSTLTFTRSPLGEVIREWRNILIEPSQVEDLKV
jgi:hypothetical protein